MTVVSDMFVDETDEKLDAKKLLIVESITKLTEAEAAVTMPVLRQVIYLTAQSAKARGAKRPWTVDQSPASAAKCRRLGRAPTEAPLPEYSLSATASADGNSAASGSVQDTEPVASV